MRDILGHETESYAGDRAFRVKMADTPRPRCRKRVLMFNMKIYGTMRKAGTIINTAPIQEFFDLRAARQDVRLGLVGLETEE